MKLTTAERARLATAFHEAGHAVAVVLAGGRIGVTEVYDAARDGHFGRTTHADLPADAERAITYSGPYAEARYLHGPHPTVTEIRAALVDTCDHAELTSVGGGLPREVEPTLDAVWPAVRSLAADLFRDGHAEHRDVLAALGATSDADMPLVTSLIKSKLWTAPAA